MGKRQPARAAFLVWGAIGADGGGGPVLAAASLDKICHAAHLFDMATMNISLPDDMRSAVDKQTEARGYGTSSEYVRDLIRRDLDRQALRALLDEGRRSAQDEPITDNTIQALRDRAVRATGQAG